MDLCFDYIKAFLCQVAPDSEKEHIVEILNSCVTSDTQRLLTNLKKLVSDLQVCLSQIENERPTLEQSHIPKPLGEELTNVVTVKTAESANEAIESNSLIQIKADNAEVERRIAAFVAHQRMDVNEANKRDFCRLSSFGVDEGCARTNAVFIPKSECRSRMRVTRACNSYGPLTCPLLSPSKRHKLSADVNGDQLTTDRPLPVPKIPSAITERLSNMESHLRLTYDSSVSSDVYERLRLLEQRILHLESLSPEYFASNSESLPGRPEASTSSRVTNISAGTVLKPQPINTEFKPSTAVPAPSLADVDNKINQLRNLLRKKQNSMTS